MSNLERENALAELIIDMELYHLSTLKDRSNYYKDFLYSLI